MENDFSDASPDHTVGEFRGLRPLCVKANGGKRREFHAGGCCCRSRQESRPTLSIRYGNEGAVVVQHLRVAWASWKAGTYLEHHLQVAEGIVRKALMSGVASAIQVSSEAGAYLEQHMRVLKPRVGLDHFSNSISK